MSAIQNLNQGALSSASQLPFGDPTNGVDRRASVADLAAVLSPLLAAIGAAYIPAQYSAPAATGFNVQIAPPTDGASVYLLLTPVAAYAAGTITLPAQALCQDGQLLQVSTTQAVTTLTVAGNGSTVNGAPATLAANGFFTLRFDGVFKAWYRIG